MPSLNVLERAREGRMFAHVQGRGADLHDTLVGRFLHTGCAHRVHGDLARQRLRVVHSGDAARFAEVQRARRCDGAAVDPALYLR